MSCYRKGGCGPYEMLSCGECPASKKSYLDRNTNNATVSKLPTYSETETMAMISVMDDHEGVFQKFAIENPSMRIKELPRKPNGPRPYFCESYGATERVALLKLTKEHPDISIFADCMTPAARHFWLEFIEGGDIVVTEGINDYEHPGKVLHAEYVSTEPINVDEREHRLVDEGGLCFNVGTKFTLLSVNEKAKTVCLKDILGIKVTVSYEQLDKSFKTV